MDSSTGKYLIIGGCVIVIVGVIVYFFHDRLHWIGRLPGDIRVERENFRFYFPVSTMILFSVVVTAIIWVIRKMF